MNKQIISMTAVAAMAGAALAVESKNVVGYQENTAINASGNTMVVPTFLTVGSATGCTLADLTVTGYDPPKWNDDDDEYEDGCAGGDFILNFLNSNGSNKARYYWIDDGDNGPGWFATSMGGAIPGGAESISIPAGQGAWVLGHGMKLRSAGQVADVDTSMQTSASGNTACGNSTPVNLTLADLTVTGYDPPKWNDDDDEYEDGCAGGDFILNFLNSNGSNKARYYWIDDGDNGPGWFATSMGGAIPGGASSVSVPAGQGLWVLGHGMTLVVPSAL